MRLGPEDAAPLGNAVAYGGRIMLAHGGAVLWEANAVLAVERTLLRLVLDDGFPDPQFDVELRTISRVTTAVAEVHYDTPDLREAVLDLPIAAGERVALTVRCAAIKRGKYACLRYGELFMLPGQVSRPAVRAFHWEDDL